MTRYRPGDTVAVKRIVTGEVAAHRYPSFPLPLRLVLVYLDDGTSRWVDPDDLEHFEPRDPAGDPICEEDT